MKLIVGLGNAGNRYANTRHNAGVMALNHYTQKKQVRFEHKTKFEAELAKKQDTIFIKPLTMMNRSGLAVRKISEFYDIPVEDILIIYDELALPFGTIRSRGGGQHAGHNGIKSIINHLKSDNFARLRIGIANEFTSKQPAEEFVLQSFSKAENKLLPEIFELSNPIIASFAESGVLLKETHKYEPEEDEPDELV
ncbi:MAG: aminoacyl-tRNA hydrolase [Candidatus Saccharimonadales bacterium]